MLGKGVGKAMRIPTIETAESLLNEAQKLNPGDWIEHNKTAGFCAKAIAAACNDLDENIAYVFGLLHDIGRRDGIMDMRHIWCGYHFMMSQGYEDSARICLTHSFPYKNIRAYNGKNDCTKEQTEFIQRFLNNCEYNDYDRLIQLCDALSFSNGATYIEKRLIDVVLRRGFNEMTLPKWRAFFEIKQYFDTKTNNDIYKLINITP